MTGDQMKTAVCETIDKHRDEIIAIGRSILENPELGFKEFKTAALVKETFAKLGLPFEDGLAITGVKARLTGRGEGPTVGILGELDAVVCPGHKHADPITGAAHSCGHNTQIASMLGAAFGLALSGVGKALDGNLVFFAVPAEEFVEIEYRESLRKAGRISFLGGKQELIVNGAFDDVDLAMMVHTQADDPAPNAYVGSSSNAFLGKTVSFRGREAHAGGAPDQGINALNAAMAAIMCIHAQRETFRDEDGIRVHPILTKGGDLVNIVPADVRMETYVRGKTMEAVLDANEKVNRAIRGGAYAIGAQVDIQEAPGYLALDQNERMTEFYARNIARFVGEEQILRRPASGGSTDMGDLSCIMPSIHPYMGGIKGAAHSQDFTIVDEEAVYIYPAKAMAMTAVDLLCEGAQEAQAICREFTPTYTPQSYRAFWKEILGGEKPAL